MISLLVGLFNLGTMVYFIRSLIRFERVMRVLRAGFRAQIYHPGDYNVFYDDETEQLNIRRMR